MYMNLPVLVPVDHRFMCTMTRTNGGTFFRESS